MNTLSTYPQTSKLVSSATILLLLALSFFSGTAMATETLKYRVIESIDNTQHDIELREYSAKIVAETRVSASYDDAGSKGFRILADYIFGNNVSRSGKTDADTSEKIAMTTPVIRTQQQHEKIQPEKIAMTTPVIQQAEQKQLDKQQDVQQKSQKNTNQQSDKPIWRIQFVMPNKYTMQTLPTPNNKAVTLKEIPAKRYAVIQFSGFTGQAKITKKTKELKNWMQTKGLTPKGEPELARYDPPWTLPFMRRNEVMIAY